MHAISSAGVAYAVTRACSSGQLRKCGCDRTVRGRSDDGFEWSGCSDNINYGTAFSTAFVDARERGKKRKNSSRALMNLHNNQAGRKVSWVGQLCGGGGGGRWGRRDEDGRLWR